MPSRACYSTLLASTSLMFILMTAACGSRHGGDVNSGCQGDSDCEVGSSCNTTTGFCEGQAVEPEPDSVETSTPTEDTTDSTTNTDEDGDETTEDSVEEPMEPTNPTLVITSPENQASAEAGMTWNFTGTIEGVPADEGPIDVTWSSGQDGIIHQEQLAAEAPSS